MYYTPPKISIVTPSFNQGEYLEECINSIISQNYPNLEYIIMDGGSTDNSVEIIKKYEKYLAYWQSKADGGQYAAIAEGFKRSTGEIMAWLNSDDKYHVGAFHRVAYLFNQLPEVEWITGRPTWWDSIGELSNMSLELPVYCRSTFLEKRYNQPFLQQESTFWRRSLWIIAGDRLRTELQFAGDLDLWLRFFRSTELYTVDALIGGYRRHGNQKASLYLNRYMEEADALITEELAHVQRGEYTRLLPAPAAIAVSSHVMPINLNDINSVEGAPKLIDNGLNKLLLMNLLKRKNQEIGALQEQVYMFEKSFIRRSVRCLRRLAVMLSFWINTQLKRVSH